MPEPPDDMPPPTPPEPAVAAAPAAESTEPIPGLAELTLILGLLLLVIASFAVFYYPLVAGMIKLIGGTLFGFDGLEMK